jgi:hypothetical protein
MAAAPQPEEVTEWTRVAAIGLILGLFAAVVGVRLYIAVEKGDPTELRDLTDLMVGFVSAVLFYLGIRVGKS